MHANFLNDVRENAVVKTNGDGSIRVWYGDIPLGRKLQTKGPRCKGRHKFERDVYEGLRHEYEDKVCKCGRRIPVR